MASVELAAAPHAGVRRPAGPSPFATLLAWGFLVLMDAALNLLGFDRFYRTIRAWPTVRPGRPGANAARAARICAAVDRGRTYYVKRAWCLQSAAAAVCFLRLGGIPAELVIGVRKIPFSAHAWAELDGVVLNNREEGMATLYQVITRC